MWHGVNARRVRTGVPSNVHPDRSAYRKEHRDDLRHRERSEKKAIVLGSHELDDESLDAREHAIQSEQPPFGVLVIAEAPQDQKHDEAERDLIELRRMDGENLIWRRAQRWRCVK